MVSALTPEPRINLSHIPPAPPTAPDSLREGLTKAALAWYEDAMRPRLSPTIHDRWSARLDEWISSVLLPLIIRKARENRGHILRHSSGRSLVPADNSPAHWSIALAFADCCPTIADVRAMLVSDQIPMAMVFKAKEKAAAHFKCTRQTVHGPNQMGWKVAHIDDVGLGYSGPLENVSIDELAAHMKRLISPGNMFLVPKNCAGVAETPEFLAAFRRRSKTGLPDEAPQAE